MGFGLGVWFFFFNINEAFGRAISSAGGLLGV
jgi:hypothetical protein